MSALAAIGLAAALAGPAPSGAPPVLELPLDCRFGATCAVQQYPDHDPGPGASDYQCGTQTYDGHDGTDLRVASLAVMRAGVTVKAAAAGVVRGVRDGVGDVSVAQIGKAAVRGRECGNGVAITLPAGWETQYCHMRKGSVRVRVGQSVAVSEPLGLVGESGDAEFPHLHLTVREAGSWVDPFAYGAAPGACGGGRSLWSKAASQALAYRSPALLNAGFATAPIQAADIEAGLPDTTTASPDAGALLFYARVINLKAGDVLALALKGPNGADLAAQATPPMDHSKAQYVQFVGRRRPGAAWPAGRYIGEVRVLRGASAVLTRQLALTVGP